jgi:hypothetical protein
MFSILELSLFQSDYFTNFNFKNGVIEVQSKNTGHWWQIYWKDMPISNFLVIKHKYKKEDKYHTQCHVHFIGKAYHMIIKHDEYILNHANQITV